MTRLTVIAGPTAVGKGTVVRYLISHHPEILLSVSATTRPPRPEEIDGVHYHFLTKAEFEELIAKNELLEYAVVHKDHLYGTPKQPVLAALAANKQIILEIDVQGAMQVKESMPSANLIFLSPPSMDELERRLRERGTESEDQMATRLQTARTEMAMAPDFDHIVINNDVAQCAADVLDLMQAN